MGNYVSDISRLSDHLVLLKAVADRPARRRLACLYLSDMLGHHVAVDYDAHGKPRLAGGGLCVNFAHRDGWLLVGTAAEEIGVDVELVQPGLDIARSHFSPGEAQWLAQSRQADAFTRLWTAKEAVLKAAGFGIVSGLAEPDFSAYLRPGAPFALDACDVAYGGASFRINWHLIADPCRPAVACSAIRHSPDTLCRVTLPAPAPRPLTALAG